MTARTTPIRIAPNQDQPVLTKGQKTFNTLVKKIDVGRKELALWQTTMVTFRQKMASDYAPLEQRINQLLMSMVLALDQSLDEKGLTKVERQTVQEVICDLADGLMDVIDDSTLKDLYNKHSATDFDTEQAEAVVAMKEAVERTLGIDLGDDANLDSPEALMSRLHEKWEQVSSQPDQAYQRKSTRKKSAKQAAREAAAKAEQEQTSLSIREVYRKLVSALHPDREPDPAERVRKTTLMQRVNQAYDKKDLLQLLELQLELEHIDAHAVAGLSEERLRHFNKILKDQLAELEQEIAQLAMHVQDELDAPPFEQLAPQQVLPRLRRNIAELKRDIRQLEQEVLIPKDRAAFKRWIKARRQEAKVFAAGRFSNDDDCPF